MRIEGRWNGGDAAETHTVIVDGARLGPARSLRVWNHSPTGFAWGYGGSGPAQLALALLLHAGLKPRRATALHQRLKSEFVAALPFERDFDVDFDLAGWIARQ